MPGYSGTPLPKKLGIKAGFRVSLLDAPAEVRGELSAELAGCDHHRRWENSARLRNGVHEIEVGTDEGIQTNQQAARTRRNVLGKLAQEEFRRGHRSGREHRPRDWLGRGTGRR